MALWNAFVTPFIRALARRAAAALAICARGAAIFLIAAIAVPAWPGTARALIEIDITRGNIQPIPVAIPDFLGANRSDAELGAEAVQRFAVETRERRGFTTADVSVGRVELDEEPAALGQRGGTDTKRPAQRNAVTYEMWKQLSAFMAELQADPAVRVVILRGAGTQAFSAGADIAECEAQRSNSALARLSSRSRILDSIMPCCSFAASRGAFSRKSLSAMANRISSTTLTRSPRSTSSRATSWS